ncbi:MAG: Fic family protein [Prolixibacteraceae bacterium]
MNLHILLPEITEIDKRLKSVKQLASYDPLVSLIRDRFSDKITHHLSSLKAGKQKAFAGKDRPENNSYDEMKDFYLGLGKERAVVELMFDMAGQMLSSTSIRLLAEILLGETSYRDSERYLLSIKGDRQQTSKPETIEDEMEKLIEWYNQSVKAGHEHPVARAAWLHYRLTVIHPFTDWNGRIARLLLNHTLMRDGYLPVLIRRDERLKYYETLEKADRGNPEPLVRFIAVKELESIQEFVTGPDYLSVQAKYELEQKLKNLDKGEKCIVLTEDSATSNLLGILLQSSGFNMAETSLISYRGCSNLGSANLFSIFVKEKMPEVKILVHRDRDYLTDAEIAGQRESFSRIDTHLFVTRGTDIESYFLNKDHVHFCHPTVSEDQAQKMIRQAMNEIFPKSVDYLWKKEFGRNRAENHSHLGRAVEELVKENLERFSHGKTTLKVLSQIIQDRLREKVLIEKPSPFLNIPELNKMACSIWNKPD